MTRKEIVNKYANELYDSIDFIEYVQFKVDYLSLIHISEPTRPY